MAGFVPPPGTYFVDVNYFYSGDASGTAAAGVALRRLGNVTGLPAPTVTVQADVKLNADAQVALPTVLWIAPGKVLGGNVGFGAIVPVGRKALDVDLDALATLTLPPPLNRTLQVGRQFHFDESTTDFGDPLANALIGWHQGNWHWNIGTLINIPIGPWSKRQRHEYLLPSLGSRHDRGRDVARPQNWMGALFCCRLHLQRGEPRHGLYDGH